MWRWLAVIAAFACVGSADIATPNWRAIGYVEIDGKPLTLYYDAANSFKDTVDSAAVVYGLVFADEQKLPSGKPFNMWRMVNLIDCTTMTGAQRLFEAVGRDGPVIGKRSNEDYHPMNPPYWAAARAVCHSFRDPIGAPVDHDPISDAPARFAELSLLQSARQSTGWVKVGVFGEPGRREAWFVDRSSVAPEGAHGKRAATMMIAEDATEPKDAMRSIYATHFDCAANTRERRAADVLGVDGSVVDRPVIIDDTVQMKPGTPAGAMSPACSGKWTGAVAMNMAPWQIRKADAFGR